MRWLDTVGVAVCQKAHPVGILHFSGKLLQVSESGFTLLANIGKTSLEIPEQILAFTGDVDRLFLVAFRTNPRREFLGGSVNEPVRASDRHP